VVHEPSLSNIELPAVSLNLAMSVNGVGSVNGIGSVNKPDLPYDSLRQDSPNAFW
jgi:hypothetical protein